jgi:hypothetical protein
MKEEEKDFLLGLFIGIGIGWAGTSFYRGKKGIW